MAGKSVALVVDDDPAVASLLRIALAGRGVRVIAAQTAEEARRVAGELRPSIVVLNVNLRDDIGTNLIPQFRGMLGIPVIALCNRATTADRVLALSLGADDCLAKPFSPDELAARVTAVLRRVIRPVDTVMIAGDLEIHLDSGLARRGGTVVRLTRLEWRLLRDLALHAGSAVSNDHLLRDVWRGKHPNDPKLVRTRISRLRAKLEEDPEHPQLIKTVAGGYVLDPHEARSGVPPETRIVPAPASE